MNSKRRVGSFLGDIDLGGYMVSCARRALRDQTPNTLRQYSFSVDHGKNLIRFKAEVDEELTEAEAEELAVVETEICADFGGDTLVETRIVIVPVGQALQPLPGGVVFTRNRNTESGR